MKNLIGFLSGLAILIMTVVVVILSAKIFDTSREKTVRPILFQPAALWQNRINPPVVLDRKTDDEIRNNLIAKFAVQYLSVVPSSFSEAQDENSIVHLLSRQDVFEKWSNSVLPELKKMASNREMHQIIIDQKKIIKQGDYFVVPITEKVWTAPNDIDAVPIILEGRELYVKIQFNKKIREFIGSDKFDAGKEMDRDFPAPAIFEFIVDEAIIK